MPESPAHPAEPPRPPRIAVISCAVFDTEMAHFTRGLGHISHVEMLEQGLHNDPDKLRTRLQEAIDQIEKETDAQAIVLGYGLCSRGTEGVRTGRCQLVMARAHDCITVLLGDKERYAEYIKNHPGTYWYSPGWNRHHTPPGKERYEKLYCQYCEKYGKDNAEYLMETEQRWFKDYDRATYVHMGVGQTPADIEYTKKCAQWLKWGFDHQEGNPNLLEALLAGDWDQERFAVMQPGQTFRMTADDRVVEVVDDPAPAKPADDRPVDDGDPSAAETTHGKPPVS